MAYLISLLWGGHARILLLRQAAGQGETQDIDTLTLLGPTSMPSPSSCFSPAEPGTALPQHDPPEQPPEQEHTP